MKASASCRFLSKHVLGLIAGAVLLAGAPAAFSAAQMHIAFGDIASVETLNFLIAIENAKARGVDIKVTYFKSEDIAAQAVVAGQADIGVGTPYALLQKVKAPIRIFYQLSALRFFPVVNTGYYKDWKDLDGHEMTVHSRGSGTEAIMRLMAQRNGIEYSKISYVPGSEVRAGAMLKGTIRATIVDAANRRVLMDKGQGKFMVLPMAGVNASDEALYANQEFLEKNAESIDILVEELVAVWRAINENPAYVVEQRKRLNLLPDLPADLEAEILPYYQESTESGAFPNNGGADGAWNDDFDFYSVAGQLQGDPKSLKKEDFWETGPLERALAKLGRA
ncbi:MAG TPA: ABC transporter substrate-binding protein [Gammaproteobacteria bacterium]|nr:ABC transporter substrate-binding protein [Gammaproteobacteria bacterium]